MNIVTDNSKVIENLQKECDDLIAFVRDIRGPLYDHDMHTWEDKADKLIAKYWKDEK